MKATQGLHPPRLLALTLTLAGLGGCASGGTPPDSGTLSVPSEVTVIPEDGAAVVFWTAPGDGSVAGYRVYRDGVPVNAQPVPASLPGGLSAQGGSRDKFKRYFLRVSGLPNRQKFKFKVAAVGADGKEGSASGEESATPLVCDRMLAHGTDMGALQQNIRVQKGGADLLTATVSVNGTSIPIQPTGLYQGPLPAELPAGAPEFLRVQQGECSLAAFDVVPEAPVLIAPATGSSVAPSAPLDVTWTSGSTPDRFVVWATWVTPAGAGTGWHSPDLPGTARSFRIPAGTLPGGMTVKVRVYAYNDGTETLAGAFEAGSRLAIRGGDEAGHDVQTGPPSSSQKPDVFIKFARASLGQVCRKDQPLLLVSVDVRNRGEVPSPAAPGAIRVYDSLHPDWVGVADLPALNPPPAASEPTVIVSVPFYTADPAVMRGSHQFKVTVNDGDPHAFDESEFGNNSFFPVEVTLPDDFCLGQ